jgi:DNA replication protein DnaC
MTRRDDAALATIRERVLDQYRAWGKDQHLTPDQLAADADIEAREQLGRLDRSWRGIVPSRFLDVHVDQLDGTLADAVAEWRQDWRRNLLLLGPVGVGKTHAALAAARLAHNAGCRVTFTSVIDLLEASRPTSRRDDRSSSHLRGAGAGAWLDTDPTFDPDAVTLDDASTADLLVLDDLGTERPTDWTGERLALLIDRRWRDGRPTLATSNLAAANGRGPLVDALGERAYSRLVHDAIVVVATGPDRRRTTP